MIDTTQDTLPKPQNNVDNLIAAERHSVRSYQSTEYASRPRVSLLHSIQSVVFRKPFLLPTLVGSILLFSGMAIFSLTHSDQTTPASTIVGESKTVDEQGEISTTVDADDLANLPGDTTTDTTPATDTSTSQAADNATQTDADPTPTTSVPTATPAKPTPVVTPVPAPAAVPVVTPIQTSVNTVNKVLIFIEENHSLDQMRSGMPYAAALADQYSYANNFYAIRHPSLPNYIALASGSTYGVTDDSAPSSHKLTGTTIFGQAIAANRTAATYADGMPSNCALTNGGTKYAVKHNPWAYFVNERASCQKYDLPFTQFDSAVTGGTLPNVGMVVPNLCNDAHDCSLATADKWFKSQMTKVFNGPDWKSGRLAVILTADEDDRKNGNKILTVVIHPSQSHKIVSEKLTLYSLSRLCSELVGAQPLLEAKKAPSMSNAFGLKVN